MNARKIQQYRKITIGDTFKSGDLVEYFCYKPEDGHHPWSSEFEEIPEELVGKSVDHNYFWRRREKNEEK